MAKLKGPILSLDATGSIGKAFAVSHWKGQPKAIKHFKPRNPRTTTQQDNRDIYSYAVMAWQSMDAADKEDYNQSAKNLNLHMSGYNYFCSEYMIAYREAPPPPPPGIVTNGLMGWWKFDENSGIYTYDAIANMRGELTNSPQWVPGKSNSALRFNGTDNFVVVPNAELSDWWKQDKEAITLEAWIWLDEVARVNIATLMLGYNTEAMIGINYHPLYVDRLTTRLTGPTGGWITAPTPTFVIDQWYHIVMTYDGEYRKLYVGGGMVGAPTPETGLLTGYGANQYIQMGTYAGFYFKGIIDECRVYDRALTDAEVLQNYNVDA